MDEAAPGSAPPPTVPNATPASSGLPSRDERSMAMLCHLLGLVSFLGPLIIWLIQREKMPYVDDQGKEALNFQISIVIYAAISGVLIFCGIGFVLAIAVAIFDLIMIIIASIAANNGERYRYPLCIRLIS
jgi:hypothetical protein